MCIFRLRGRGQPWLSRNKVPCLYVVPWGLNCLCEVAGWQVHWQAHHRVHEQVQSQVRDIPGFKVCMVDSKQQGKLCPTCLCSISWCGVLWCVVMLLSLLSKLTSCVLCCGVLCCVFAADWAAGEGHIPAGVWQEGCVQQLHSASSSGRAAAACDCAAGDLAVCSTSSQQHQAAAGGVQPSGSGCACLRSIFSLQYFPGL